MLKHKNYKGHVAALITILIWGTTFISTKVLLRTFTPIEILFVRFIIGYMALWLIYPHPMKSTAWKQELYFAAAGLCGVTLYYLLENIALTYTLASNVGVVTSVAPFFTAIFSFIRYREQPRKSFFIGFLVAISGICLISFRSISDTALNPLGDLLALLAAATWALYAVLGKKINHLGYHIIQITRRTFFYGLIFMLPALFFMDFQITAAKLGTATNLLNLLFLSIGASALCFVTWNYGIKILGAVKTSVYIYAVPAITALFSAIILREEITFTVIFGIGLTILGLLISQGLMSIPRQTNPLQ